MTRWRITVRGDGIELRGFVDADTTNQVERLFADDLEESGAMIVMSPAESHWNPFL